MRYLVKARLKPGKAEKLKRAIEDGSLGAGSIAGSEYIRDMQQARQLGEGLACWLEVCFCPEPLQEEQPYWEEYFEIVQIKNAHAPEKCRDLNGTEPWACSDCDCTEKLETRMEQWGVRFLERLSTED